MKKPIKKVAKAKPSDKSILSAMIRDWARALEARDVDAMMKEYAPDVMLYDIKPPYRVQGVAAVREVWEQCLPYFPARFKSEHRELKLIVGQDVAFCHCLHHITPIDEPNHPAGGTWFRVTVGYKKVKGRWKVAHEHVSVPFDPMTGKVSYIAEI